VGWKETRVQDERLLLVEEFAAGERSRAEICRRYGVSRKTGYKWYEQFLLHGIAGLGDRSRKPLYQPNAVDEETVGAILEARSRYPSWGERKLKAWLEREHRERRWPSTSSIGSILQRYGLTWPHKRRRRATPSSTLTQPQAANQVWAIDFKGWFRTGDGQRCDPLTLSDTHTRYLLRCQAVDQTGGKFIRPLLEASFREYGLPARITPGHPEQNGRHERMHRTLKQETARPPARSVRAQQMSFDRFREEYNQQRPHEALEMATPASAYEPSLRRFPERLPEMEYPASYLRRQVELHGNINWRFGRVFLGEVLAGETVGVEEVADGWRIWFGPLLLAWLDARQVNDPKAKRDNRGRGRWKLTLLAASGRPLGSRRRPTTPTRKTRSSADHNP
jgi:putative transposase